MASEAIVAWVYNGLLMITASKSLLERICLSHKNMIILEENSKIGALGDKIIDIVLLLGIPIQIKKIGIPRQFCVNYGTPEDHRKALGLDSNTILETISV